MPRARLNITSLFLTSISYDIPVFIFISCCILKAIPVSVLSSEIQGEILLKILSIAATTCLKGFGMDLKISILVRLTIPASSAYPSGSGSPIPYTFFLIKVLSPQFGQLVSLLFAPDLLLGKDLRFLTHVNGSFGKGTQAIQI